MQSTRMFSRYLMMVLLILCSFHFDLVLCDTGKFLLSTDFFSLINELKDSNISNENLMWKHLLIEHPSIFGLRSYVDGIVNFSSFYLFPSFLCFSFNSFKYPFCFCFFVPIAESNFLFKKKTTDSYKIVCCCFDIIPKALLCFCIFVPVDLTSTI